MYTQDSIYIPAAGITIKSTDYTIPAGKYEGVILTNIPDGLLNFQDPTVCYVSGSGGNPFGHALLMISPSIGYVHACQPGLHPVRFIPHDEWGRFLGEMGKTEWKMLPIGIPNVDAAKAFVRNALLNGFNWGITNNCVDFCSAAIQQGGGAVLPTSSIPSNATTQQFTIKQPQAKHPYDSINDDQL